jgi:hypothetical protein
MRVEPRDLDRPFEPCPLRCSLCRRRGEIVGTVPKPFTPIDGPLEPPAHRSTF